MTKAILMKAGAILALTLTATTNANGQNIQPIKYGDMNQWVTRHVKESAIIGGNTKTLVAQNKYFTASAYTIGEKLSLEVTAKTFKNIVVLDGEFFIENMKFQKGESAFLPAGEGKAEIEGSGKLLITEV